MEKRGALDMVSIALVPQAPASMQKDGLRNTQSAISVGFAPFAAYGNWGSERRRMVKQRPLLFPFFPSNCRRENRSAPLAGKQLSYRTSGDVITDAPRVLVSYAEWLPQ